MNVSLAAQVLSATTANTLKQFYGSDTHETAEFCKLMDMFFDALNVRSTKEGQFKRKKFLQPYTSLNDEKFHWLESFF